MLARAAEVEHHWHGLPSRFRSVEQIGQFIDRALPWINAMLHRIDGISSEPTRLEAKSFHPTFQFRRFLVRRQLARIAVAGAVAWR